jgi:hypothetical protein
MAKEHRIPLGTIRAMTGVRYKELVRLWCDYSRKYW